MSLRVVSLLPSATEILCSIGGSHLLVGRSHEDNYPSNITHLPILTGQRTSWTTAADVDRQVSTALTGGQSLYTLDLNLLKQLEPSVILTQSLCSVCGERPAPCSAPRVMTHLCLCYGGTILSRQQSIWTR